MENLYSINVSFDRKEEALEIKENNKQVMDKAIIQFKIEADDVCESVCKDLGIIEDYHKLLEESLKTVSYDLNKLAVEFINDKLYNADEKKIKLALEKMLKQILEAMAKSETEGE